ncbi:MAG: LysE family translocator [Candidatus Egerieousia sp.]
MPASLFPTLLISLFLVGYTPGPANIYAMHCSLKYGLKRGMRAWFGEFVGFSLMALLSAVVCHIVGEAIGGYVGWIKYIGSAYLIYLAWKIYKSKGAIDNNDKTSNFLSGFLVQVTNAKMIVFDFVTYGTFVLPYSNKLVDLFEVAVLLLIAGPGANLAWLLLGSTLSKFYNKHVRTLDTIMAAALFLCAVYILF